MFQLSSSLFLKWFHRGSYVITSGLSRDCIRVLTWFHQTSHVITSILVKAYTVPYLSNNPPIFPVLTFSLCLSFFLWSFLHTESNFVSCRCKCCSAILHRHREWTELVQSWGKNRRFNARPQTGLRNKVRIGYHFQVEYSHGYLRQSFVWVSRFSLRKSQDRDGQKEGHVAEREGAGWG